MEIVTSTGLVAGGQAALVGLLIGLIEALKRMGLSTRLAPVVTVALGATFNVVVELTVGTAAEHLVHALLTGLVVGLTAAGLYDVGRSAAKATTPLVGNRSGAGD